MQAGPPPALVERLVQAGHQRGRLGFAQAVTELRVTGPYSDQELCAAVDAALLALYARGYLIGTGRSFGCVPRPPPWPYVPEDA